MKNRHKVTVIKIEAFIAILIGICIIILMDVHSSREEEGHRRYLDTLFISEDQLSEDDAEFKDIILEYRPRPYKMIEIYNSDFSLDFRIQFRGEFINNRDLIVNHPELIEYFNSHDEGHTYYTLDDDETDVYFKWVDTENNGTEQLAIIYTSRPQKDNHLIHSTICYIILMLAFMIAIISTLRQSSEKIIQYKHNQDNIFDHINRR